MGVCPKTGTALFVGTVAKGRPLVPRATTIADARHHDDTLSSVFPYLVLR